MCLNQPEPFRAAANQANDKEEDSAANELEFINTKAEICFPIWSTELQGAEISKPSGLDCSGSPRSRDDFNGYGRRERGERDGLRLQTLLMYAVRMR